MEIVNDMCRKYREGGLEAVSEAIWRNTLRRTPVGTTIELLGSEVLVEKLVMAPKVGYWPRIRNPRSFNEHIMHRKLFTDEQIFATLSDKAAVWEYVAEQVGDHVLTDVYHISSDPDTIPFDELPGSFVIKSTHGSGDIIIVDDKQEADVESIRNECREWLSKEVGTEKGEYWYGNIEPQIIIEQRLVDEDHGVPPDYKHFVFDGEVKVIQVDMDRFSNHTRRFYDPEWNPLEFELQFPIAPEMQRPEQLEQMIDVAEQLGEGFDFVRVDLYQPNGETIVFGEITVSPGNGGERFRPKKYDFELGSHWPK